MIYKNKIEKGLFGWISKIKDRMYRTITPRGYHIGQAAKEFIKGNTRDMSKFTPLENEVWARYLGTKYEGPSNLEPAIYRPTKGGATYDDVVKLKDESLILSDNVLKLLLDNYKKTGKKSMLVEGNESGLGTYTLSMGEDEKGKYISYYDDWDINPTRGISAKYNIPILNLIGDIVPGTHSFSVYGRRYYKNGGLIRKMETAAGGPLRPTSYLDSFESEWKKEYKKGIQKIPEITITGKKRYVMSADPNHQTKFIGAMVGPFKNLLSPTQGARLVYDTGKALSGDMSFTDWSKSLMENNNGIVTDEFAEEHPYLSTGINLVGDIGVGGGALLSKTNLGQEAIARAKGVLDATKYGLYDRVLGYNLYNRFLRGKTTDLRDLLRDIDLFSGENYIGDNKIRDKSGMLFMLPTTYTRSEFIDSGQSIRMGFNANNGKLSRNLINQGKEAIDKLPAGTSISADAHGLSVPSRLATEGNKEGIITTLSKGTSDSETTLSNLEKRLGEDPGTFERNPYDMSADAHRFFTLEAQKPGRQLVYAGRSGLWNNAAISNPQVYKWQEAYNAGNLSAREYVNNYNNWVKNFGGRPGHVDISGKPYFYHPTIFITHKQGGKMNAIEQFKQGSKIHIKKKNRGKFTAYCGGNVTSACIAKAKASGNPTLVKRATFAANARKWKHKEGGIIKALTGIILGPAPNITRKPIVKEILSYLPITGSIVDTETAIKNPTLSNIGWAAWSTGSDIFGGRILRDLLKALKAYKETKAVTKAAEEALDTHRKTTKNIIARSVREEDQNLVNALQKARELEALKWGELYWNKAITYPVYGGWIANDAGINYLLNHKNGGIIKAETGLSTSSFIDPMIVDYIKAIENPNRVGWNGKIWKAPGLKGYDLNLRGYGIDINTNNAARKLTAGRQGQWLTDDEANTLMLDHIRYIMNAANKHIKGFGELPIGRKAALLGMLYRGDSVNKSNINITEPDDTKFFNSVHNYYISKGLKERANNSSKFFKSYGNSNTLNFNFNNYKDLNYPFKYIQ